MTKQNKSDIIKSSKERELRKAKGFMIDEPSAVGCESARQLSPLKLSIEKEIKKMTRLSYDIVRNGKVVKKDLTTSYQMAKKIVKELGSGWTIKPRYTSFDPDDTDKSREIQRKHAEKYQMAMRQKRYEKELASAPAYINATGIGAT